MIDRPHEFFQFPQVYVVEASAGSGKTYALAKRYLQLLLNPALHSRQIVIRSILAITFTNKAAFEMKARILEFLRKIALKQLNPGEEQDILATIGLDRDAASDKAHRIMDDLIRNYNFFQVQTIDSFINALLSGCAFKIGLSSGFKIKTNSREYLELSLDQMIDAARDDKQLMKVFENFLHQYLFLENRTGWFPKKDILALIGALFSQTNIFGYPFRSPKILPAAVIQRKSEIIRLMQELRENLPEEIDKRFLKSLESFLLKNAGGFQIDNVSDYFLREAMPVNKGGKISAAADRLWQQIRHELQAVVEEESRSTFTYYVQVFNHVLTGFKQLAARDDILFLEELNKEARLLFDEEKVTVEELYYRLATRFRHYLVDEFQDTSLLQWQNLILMVEEALSTGGSLFYVGDKKQAIYGFRGGEVRLFDQIKERFNDFNVITRTLQENRRSQKAIVDFNNQIFSAENLKRFIADKEILEQEKSKKSAVVFNEADIDEVLNVFHGAQQACLAKGGPGYVQVERVDGDNKEERDHLSRQKLLELFKELKTRFANKDLAVLVRNNGEAELVTAWLLEEGIPVNSERTSNIQENFVVKELISFFKFLNSPIDNLAFSNFILGDVFATASKIPLDELRRFVFDLRERIRQEKEIYIYKEFRERYPEVWATFLEEFFGNVGLYPLYELTVSMLHRFRCLQHFPEYQGFVMRFLELIKASEDEGADIESFLEYFEKPDNPDVYLTVSETDAVKVLTIHKSKGLEFPVVILPFLGMDIQVGAGGQAEKPYVVDFHDDHLELLYLKSRYTSFSEELADIYRREYRKSFLAELNNAYVALTRPQQELYVFIPKKYGSSVNLINFLIPEGPRVLGIKSTAVIAPRSKIAPPMQLPPAEYEDWFRLLEEEFVDTRRVKERQKLLKGDILHFILSFIGNLEKGELSNILDRAMDEAGKQFVFEATTDLRTVVERMTISPDLRPFFFTGDAEVFQEKDIVDADGETKRIDRLIIRKDEVWIVDYKSSRLESAEYRDQVLGYVRLVRALYPQKAVRGFLIYFDSFDVEEVVL